MTCNIAVHTFSDMLPCGIMGTRKCGDNVMHICKKVLLTIGLVALFVSFLPWLLLLMIGVAPVVILLLSVVILLLPALLVATVALLPRYY